MQNNLHWKSITKAYGRSRHEAKMRDASIDLLSSSLDRLSHRFHYTLMLLFSPSGDCAWSACRVNDHCAGCCSLSLSPTLSPMRLSSSVGQLLCKHVATSRVTRTQTDTMPYQWSVSSTDGESLHSIRYISSVSSLWSALFVSQCPLDQSPTHNGQWSHCRRKALD